MWTIETWVVVTLNGAINLQFAEASCCFMFLPCFCFKFSRNAEQGRHFSGYSLVGHSLGGLVARVVPVHIDLKPRHLVTAMHRGHHTWSNLIRKLSLEKCEKSRNTWWLEGLPEFIWVHLLCTCHGDMFFWTCNLQLYISQSWRALFHVHFSTPKKRSLQSRSLQLNLESTSPWKRLRCFRLTLQSPCWCRDLCVSHSDASSSPSNRSWQRSSCRCAGERRWEEHFDQTFGGKICRFLHGIRETGSSLKIGKGGSLKIDDETLEKCRMPARVSCFLHLCIVLFGLCS